MREAAVAALAVDPAPIALRFLLLRAADWVPQVQIAAQHAVADRLARPDIEELVACLALATHLVSTARGADTAAATIRAVQEHARTDTLVHALTFDDVVARRAAAKLLVDRHAARAALDAALRQADPRTRLIIGMAAVEEVHNGDRDALLRRLLATRSSLVELAPWTLLREAPDRDELAVDMLRHRLFAMRVLARYHLTAVGFDVRGFYEALLPVDPIAGLRGLGDCRVPGDAAKAAGHLADPDPVIRRTAVETVARLDGAKYSELLVRCLADEAPSVSTAAARARARSGLPSSSLEPIWTIATSDGPSHVVRSCARAARGLSRWPRLRFALRSVATDDSVQREIGLALTDQTLDAWNRSFLAPTPAEAAEIAQLLDSTRDRLGGKRFDRLVATLATCGIAPRP